MEVIPMHFARFLKGLDIKIENKGEELEIHIKGDREKIAHVERKLGAVKELCCGCCDEERDGNCC